MARGLSDLQKTILTYALDRRDRGQNDRGLDMEYRFFCESQYKWEPNVYSKLRFDRKSIGLKEYNKRKVALTKAVKRLEARGLVERWANFYNTGIKLTYEGVRTARILLVNKVP